MANWESVLEELFTGVMGMQDPTVWIMFLIGGAPHLAGSEEGL